MFQKIRFAWTFVAFVVDMKVLSVLRCALYVTRVYRVSWGDNELQSFEWTVRSD